MLVDDLKSSLGKPSSRTAIFGCENGRDLRNGIVAGLCCGQWAPPVLSSIATTIPAFDADTTPLDAIDYANAWAAQIAKTEEDVVTLHDELIERLTISSAAASSSANLRMNMQVHLLVAPSASAQEAPLRALRFARFRGEVMQTAADYLSGQREALRKLASGQLAVLKTVASRFSDKLGCSGHSLSELRAEFDEHIAKPLAKSMHCDILVAVGGMLSSLTGLSDPATGLASRTDEEIWALIQVRMYLPYARAHQCRFV